MTNFNKQVSFIIAILLSLNTYSQCPIVAPSGVDACILSPGIVPLSASGGSGYYAWYDALVGGNFLGSGPSFTTPVIATTTTYYVAASDTNTSLNFDGANDFVALGNPAQLQITGDMTIEMWLKPSNFSNRRNPYAKAYGGEGTITQETSGTLSFYYGTNGGNSTPYQGFSSNSPLTLNRWNHIAIVRDLTNMKLYWYINGVLTNQTNANYATATAGANSASIGKGYVSNYAGEIDELRIWNSARSQAEVSSNSSLCLTGAEIGLAAYYQNNDGVGSLTTTDLSGNANHGTLTNMDASTDWTIADYDYQCISCESGRTPVIATVGVGSGVELGNDTAFLCSTTAITLDAAAGYTNYLWSTGEITQTITANITGSYWVGVDDGAGCYDGDTIRVNASGGSSNALTFGGGSNYVALGNPAQLQITGDMTIEMWLKPSNFSSRRNPYAKAYGGEGTITQEIAGTLSYFYGTSGVNSTPYQGFSSSSPLTLNRWNHIAIVRDLTNMQLYWYINGVLTNQVVANYAVAAAGFNPAYIAKGYTANYAGEIDELRIWSSARTEIEIKANMCSKINTSEPNLAAYYNFDDGAGVTLTDLSINKNDGVLTSGPTWLTSGAPIGDNSTYLYTNSWGGKSLSLSLCAGENLTVDNMSGAPEGVHIYSVGSLPSVVTGISGLGTNNRYFGVFKINDAAATYTATYDYTGNPHVGVSSEPTVQLFKRDDNADLTWINTGAVLNTGANTLIAAAQGTEFMLGSSGVPLPIELISFDAVVNDDLVDLTWLTASEINNDYFTVERSDDTKRWEEVLDVTGAGNSVQTIAYLEKDITPLKGISYYRLKQTDFDGEFSYSNIVAVNITADNVGIGSISVFPNPTTTDKEINVKFRNITEQQMTIALRDVYGKVIYTKEVKNVENGKLIQIPLEGKASKGIYFVIASSENKVYSVKLIVN